MTLLPHPKIEKASPKLTYGDGFILFFVGVMVGESVGLLNVIFTSILILTTLFVWYVLVPRARGANLD